MLGPWTQRNRTPPDFNLNIKLEVRVIHLFLLVTSQFPTSTGHLTPSQERLLSQIVKLQHPRQITQRARTVLKLELRSQQSPLKIEVGV